MLAKLLLLSVGAQAVLQSSLLEQSASAAQLQMQAENLQAMWLDYKSSEQELMSEHESPASSLLELGTRMSTEHQQELAAKRNSAKVLEAMVASLEAANKNDQSLAVDARGQVKKMDAEALSAAEVMAEERLIASSRRTAQTAEQTSASWMEAFVNSEDAELRTAVAQAEDAFRHLTGQRHSMEIENQVQELWRSKGVRTNAYHNQPPLSKRNVDDASLMELMDNNADGKITWHEAHQYYARKLHGEKSDMVAYLAETTLADQASQEATDHVAGTFKDGLSQEITALDAAVEKALGLTPKEEVKAAALIQEKAEEKTAEKSESKVRSFAIQTQENMALRAQAEMYLSSFIEAEKERKEAEKDKKEKRWERILARQQSALLQQEQSVKAEEKELLNLEREEAWQQSRSSKQEQQVKDSACAGVKSTVHAFITASQDQAHASCLKSQVGACISTEVSEAPQMKCDEPSAGWQRKCFAEKAAAMADCAPMGVDWNAMRRGETGVAADNAALQLLSEWCTMHRALGKIEQSKAAAPFSLILSKNAALSKDATAKLADFGENFKGQNWDLLQVDPVGNPAPLHSVVVKSASAGKIKKAMSLMKAMPLEMMPKALNNDPKYDTKAVAWNAGVSGLLEKTNGDCSLESPALLKPQKEGMKNKLVAALR
eukprot:gnl/MRDRNA2_/MRDRNA2_85461_c0_seq1.p1 gnl/MRDRNA2_/MRDRNA2_85461_c0~~gnl/MRDRNA2_/MRDRNA2_85461_c0_seq1.p1  ORF type:complete len:661 (+),score=226.20 gnl/MRDRNA2_/MRDRNA2_85461_c0_seq1:68-2050(+)